MFVRTPEKRRRSFVGVRGITGDGLPSKVIVMHYMPTERAFRRESVFGK